MVETIKKASKGDGAAFQAMVTKYAKQFQELSLATKLEQAKNLNKRLKRREFYKQFKNNPGDALIAILSGSTKFAKGGNHSVSVIAKHRQAHFMGILREGMERDGIDRFQVMKKGGPEM
jgi:hypothetical protein